jgi:hypothetical protein
MAPTRPLIQFVLSVLSSELKRPGRETNHSPPSSGEVKNGGAVPPLRHMSSWRGAQLIEQRDSLPLPLPVIEYPYQTYQPIAVPFDLLCRDPQFL